jgi:protein involved in polysaccharide export with SLBB domain
MADACPFLPGISSRVSAVHFPFLFSIAGNLSMRRFIGQLCSLTGRWIAIVCSISVFACGPTDTMRVDTGTNIPTVIPAPSSTSEPENANEMAKLEHLWRERQTANLLSQDYPIGPGDVLTVSVPDVELLAQRRVRVSPRGTFELPLLGEIQAGGLSEDGLAAEIDDKLQKYMYQPQANVFVEEYHNRAVAIVGAVNRPGLVLLASPSESLLDVITQAGGLSSAAADQVILIPARPGSPANSRQLAAPVTSPATNQITGGAAGGPAVSADSVAQPLANSAFEEAGRSDLYLSSKVPELAEQHDDIADSASNSSQLLPSATPVSKTSLGAPSLPGHDDAQFAAGAARRARSATTPGGRAYHDDAVARPTPPNFDQALQLAGSDEAITFKLSGATLAGVGNYVNMPMRPGDVVIVPGGGDVMVVGWVHQPGRFQVGSGLTVLGAIGAAGGPMYAAQTKSIALIRSDQRGGKITIPINMDQIARGQAVDLPVQANDVIDVPYSGLRIGPYIFYSILTKVGVGGPVIPY